MEGVSPSLKTRFIAAWQRVIGRAIMFGRPSARPYRSATNARRVHGSAASWRSVVGGSSWTGKKAARRHKAWTAEIRRGRARAAAFQQLDHAQGRTKPKVLSRRAYHRASLRFMAKSVF